MEEPIKIFHCYHLMIQSFKNIAIYKKKFYWNIIALKYCVSAVKRISCMFKYILSLLNLPPILTIPPV